MLRSFTRIVWACVAVGLTITLVSYALGLVPRTSGADNGASASAATPIPSIPFVSPAVVTPSATSGLPTATTMSATPTATSVATLTPAQ